LVRDQALVIVLILVFETKSEKIEAEDESDYEDEKNEGRLTD
jgi:hypothetical protein